MFSGDPLALSESPLCRKIFLTCQWMCWNTTPDAFVFTVYITNGQMRPWRTNKAKKPTIQSRTKQSPFKLGKIEKNRLIQWNISKHCSTHLGNQRACCWVCRMAQIFHLEIPNRLINVWRACLIYRSPERNAKVLTHQVKKGKGRWICASPD